MAAKKHVSENPERIRRARINLKSALDAYRKAKGQGDLPFLTLAKTLEVLTEYTWKDLKTKVEEQGLFAPSPKEAIRQAATIGIIDDPESWLRVINARNDSVHDYFNIPEKDYAALAEKFLELTQELYEQGRKL